MSCPYTSKRVIHIPGNDLFIFEWATHIQWNELPIQGKKIIWGIQTRKWGCFISGNEIFIQENEFLRNELFIHMVLRDKGNKFLTWDIRMQGNEMFI